MATYSLHSIQQHSLFKPHHSSHTLPSTLSSSLFLKPTTTNTKLTLSPSSSSSSSSSSSYSSNSYLTFSLSQTTSSATTPSTSQTTISYDLLTQHLSSKNYQLADEETRRLLIVLAGEAAQKSGYVFFSQVQFISETDLKIIDELWRKHSDNKFGYSVQKKIFEKVNGDFTKFFIKVGWMKKLDTEMEQYNYKSFPTEFIWELNDGTPEGHLPLTNALRGTQLLYNIFNHPAFDAAKEEQAEVVFENKDNTSSSSSSPLAMRMFKTDYSF